MTTVDTPRAPTGAGVRPDVPPPTGRRLGAAAVAWLLVLVLGGVIAAVALGALAESRTQRARLAEFRAQVDSAAEAAEGPFGATVPTDPPETGSPVALLQIGRTGLQRVVGEGSRPGDTQGGPGHVPGTAGPGQPGNSAIIGRRSGYGGAFGQLDDLQVGDEILVTTVQGQTVYRVRDNATRPRAELGAALDPTTDDRLTLVTGTGPLPGADIRVVTAEPNGRPFPPTPQGGRAVATDGGAGQDGARPLVLIWAVLLAATAGAAVVLYRRWYPRSTYLLTTPALVALLVLFADSVARVLPAWL